MAYNFYDKPEWRKFNLGFLKKAFGLQDGQHLPGSYVELIGGHNPDDEGSVREMFYLMKSSNVIAHDNQFIGVDNNPVLLLQRKIDKPNVHSYPLVFGDIFTTLKKVQNSRGALTGINQHQTQVNPNVVAINFDIGTKVVLNPHGDREEWWTRNASDIRAVLKKAWEYTDRVAFIGNFSRDRGSEKVDNPNIRERIAVRKGYLLESIRQTFLLRFNGNDNDIINSFEDFQCRGQMIAVRFVARKRRGKAGMTFFTKEGVPIK